MTGFDAFKAIGTIASIVRTINALKDSNNSTAEDLFKESCIEAVKQSAPNFVDITDPAEVDMDSDTLVTLLKDIDISTLTSLEENAALAKITAIFQKCIILPRHQLTEKDLERRLQPVIKKTFAIFFEQLPRNQQATNETMLEFGRSQLVNQEGLIKDNQAIKGDTNEIKEMTQANLAVNLDVRAQLTDFSNRQFDLRVSEAVKAAVAAEHKAEIDNAQDLLNKHQPDSALSQLERLKDRIWEDASSITKFRILTGMGATQLALNKEREAAILILKACPYNPEDETALSNSALAHFLLRKTEMAEKYAEKALEKNPTNINAYRTLIEISTDDETLEEVIAKVPEYLQEDPQIAYAISNIAKQRVNFEEARKWRKIAVANDDENVPDFKAALAALLIEQVTDDEFAVSTNQLNNSQTEQLEKAIELLTEAWDSVADTELRTVRIDWVINRSMAQHLLGNSKGAIKDLDTALEIEQLDPILLKNRAILAFEQGQENAIEFVEKILPAPETPEAPILLASILFVSERYNEAITTLKDFLATNPSTKLEEDANRLLVQTYIADKRFEEAQQISTSMLESSPTSVLNLVNAAQVSSATEESEKALSQLKEAYNLAQSSDVFQEIFELANELGKHEQFKEAAVLYEKLADTNYDSQWTQLLLYSYYRSGEAAKALEICQELRERHGLLENTSKIEYHIYKEIGDLNQAQMLGEAYLNVFPDDADMQIDLVNIHYRLNNIEEFHRLLEKSFDLKELSLPACFELAHWHHIGAKPEIALDIMYETRRTHHNNPDAYLKYIGLFFQVAKQLDELLNPIQVELGTAVCIDRDGQNNWYIIEKRSDPDPTRNERGIEDPLVERLLGKTVGDEIYLGEGPLGPEIGKITAIESKYTYAYKESPNRFFELFPGAPGLWSVKLDESSGDSTEGSHETDDSSKFQPIFDLTDKQYEESLRIEEVYKKMLPPIGVLASWMRGNVLGAWESLISNSDLGVRCSTGDFEERRQALALIGGSQPKLVVDIISLMTLHCLEATDTIVKAFGRLGIAQSTIDLLLTIIHEQKGMWSEREAISPWKENGQYIKYIIKPEDVRRNIERLEDLVKWIRENCEVLPCTAALQMNLLRKRKLDSVFQPSFIDTMLIASQPGYLLFSDDERLRFYAKTGFNSDAGTDFDIDGVWTQVVLEHCISRNLLDRTEYNKMVIKLICLNYYHTEFDAEVLIEGAKQSDWKPSEPYNTLVQALGGQRVSLSFALNVATDFLFQLWTQSIVPSQSDYLTHTLLDGLTFGRRPRSVLMELANQVLHRFEFHPLVEREVLSLIRANALTHIF